MIRNSAGIRVSAKRPLGRRKRNSADTAHSSEFNSAWKRFRDFRYISAAQVEGHRCRKISRKHRRATATFFYRSHSVNELIRYLFLFLLISTSQLVNTVNKCLGVWLYPCMTISVWFLVPQKHFLALHFPVYYGKNQFILISCKGEFYIQYSRYSFIQFYTILLSRSYKSLLCPLFIEKAFGIKSIYRKSFWELSHKLRK